MALTDASMATSIRNELRKVSFMLDGDDLQALCFAIAKGVVTNLKANADIIVATAAFTSTPAAVGSPVTSPIAPTTLKIT